MREITRILGSRAPGDASAADKLLPLVYEELRRLAAQKMAHEAAGHTLQPTALVHEAWLRLGGPGAPAFQNRAHFFGAAAEAMRRILIERCTGLQQRQASLPPFLNAPRRITESLERLVQLYDAWGKPAQATEWKQKLAKFQQTTKAVEKKGAQP